MIDKESEVYTRLRKAILAKYPNASIASTYVQAPTKFPHIQIMQTDSYEPQKYIDSSMKENFSVITFQIDIFSNHKSKAKSECKAISAIVDDVLRSMNFRREALATVPNMYDATIYRMTGRYKVMADREMFYSA